MPLLTRRFIKVAFVYLVLTLLVGIVLMARNVWNLPPIVAGLSPIYIHIFMMGWVTQMIFGVVYWMFPIYSKEKPHRNESLWQATFWLLNVGLLLRVVGEPMQTAQPALIWGIFLAVSAVLQWLAVVGFVVNTWERVKGR